MEKEIKFISKARIIHNDKYDYSKIAYNGIKNKVKIMCPIHGEFEQTPHHHVTRKQGCPKCRYLTVSIKTRKSNEQFIEKAEFIHEKKYDYSLVEYVNAKTKIKIICPEHGVFEQLSYAHLYGQGCPKCIGLNKTTDTFVKDAKMEHGDKYDYSKTVYKDSKSKIEIVCEKHGVFTQTPNMHLRGNGCPICKESKGEKKIREYLIKNGVKFKQQHTFPNCKNIQVLQFDFYLPDYNTCIEFDGIQHYKPVNRFGGEKSFLLTKQNDSIKNKFCLVNKINLKRIPYFEDVFESLNNLIVK
jgi:Zn finger protein HypA/HybF involved in hydrogenase expression